MFNKTKKISAFVIAATMVFSTAAYSVSFADEAKEVKKEEVKKEEMKKDEAKKEEAKKEEPKKEEAKKEEAKKEEPKKEEVKKEEPKKDEMKKDEAKAGMFNDTMKHWAKDSVKEAVEAGLFKGITATEFAPNQTMNRAMLFTAINRMSGEEAKKVEGPWYAASMEWAKEKKISDGTMPKGNITREQLATMLYRYANAPEVKGNLDKFADKEKVSAYAKAAMVWATENKMIAGKTGNNLDPAGNATRAEVATILVRFKKNVKIEAKKEEPKKEEMKKDEAKKEEPKKEEMKKDEAKKEEPKKEEMKKDEAKKEEAKKEDAKKCGEKNCTGK